MLERLVPSHLMLCMEFNEDLPFQSDDLDELINKFEIELKCVMDVEAPEKKITLSTPAKPPCYDHDVKAEHQIVRNRERVWLRYKMESNWWNETSITDSLSTRRSK